MSIQLLPVLDVLRDYRPGSFDRDWAAEFRDLGSPERIKEMALRTWDQHGNPRDELLLKMLRGEPIEPVTLGWDGGEWNGRTWKGRVWAGHHRLWIHWLVGREFILADVVPLGEKRSFPANHCAPAAGRCDVYEEAAMRHLCPDCGAETKYQVMSGGREWYCPDCDAYGAYPEGAAPRRAQMLADGRYDELRAEMREELARLATEDSGG